MPMYERALVIVPPNITYNNFRFPTKNTKSWLHSSGVELGVIITDVPLGALTIAEWLKEKHSIATQLLDFNVEIHKTWNHLDDDSFESWFRDSLEAIDFVPDLIGFSSLFVTGYKNLFLLGKICSEMFPAATTIIGGNLATTMYGEIFDDDREEFFDALCFGEGELPLEELIKSSDSKTYLDSSPHWITRNSYKTSQFEHLFIENLDEIPPLNYELLSVSDYQHSPTIKAYTQIEDTTNYITYMTSRGCPFLCTFCSAHTVHGRKMRYFSLERIGEELRDLQSVNNANTLVIEDDHFLSDNDRAKGVLKIARELGLKCVFPNALALYGLDRSMLEVLSSCGVRQLTLAVESGSPRVLKKLMKKPLRIDITERVAKDCYEMGIYTDCNIIIGMPGETMEDIAVAREFLRELPANWYRINVATPLAGSEMYEVALENRQMVGDVREAGYKSCVIETEHFTPDQINEVAYSMNLELNFVHNTDMQMGNFERAIESFDNVLALKHDHAFALFFKAKCSQAIGQNDAAREAFSAASTLFIKDPVWNFYFVHFGLEFENLDVPYTSRDLEAKKKFFFSIIPSGIGRGIPAVNVA